MFKAYKTELDPNNKQKTLLYHKATTAITKQAKVLCVESLNVAGMMKNHKLAKSLADSSMSEFSRQLEYKAKWANIPVIKADRFYASSKLCSSCGCTKEDLKLSDRTYTCEHCDLSIDRDLNAAINLRNLAESHSDKQNVSEDIKVSAMPKGAAVSVCERERKFSCVNNW
jgi:putative transposase